MYNYRSQVSDILQLFKWGRNIILRNVTLLSRFGHVIKRAMDAAYLNIVEDTVAGVNVIVMGNIHGSGCYDQHAIPRDKIEVCHTRGRYGKLIGSQV